jgi:hypothetical protein
MLAGLFVPGGETASPLVGRLPADRFFAQLTDMTALRQAHRRAIGSPCALIMELAANAPACRAANSMINAGIAQLGRGAKKS